MDTLSHTLLGFAVASLSDQTPSLSSGLYWSVWLGAQAPDSDILLRSIGALPYLKQHRTASHSALSLLVWPSLIAALVTWLLPHESFLTLWWWALAGTLSHLAADLLNTHGIALGWPFYRRRVSWPLCNVFDPILLLSLSLPYLSDAAPRLQGQTALGLAGLYLLGRLLARTYSYRQLRRRFPAARLTLMPSLRHIICWDFIAETTDRFETGYVSLGAKYCRHLVSLPKTVSSEALERAKQTWLGQAFNRFTPFCYSLLIEYPTHTLVYFYDLRYYLHGRFRHCASLLLSRQGQLLQTNWSKKE